jgi:hypothetical protein
MALLLLSGCGKFNVDVSVLPSPEATLVMTALKVTPTRILQPSPTTQAALNDYSNTQYGFSFSLPASWEGYSIGMDKWEGLRQSDDQGEVVVEQGPTVSIVHPNSTPEQPRQNIPIMVFTIQQWDRLQAGEWHVGAAPIGPSELGRNSRYVFALPARYNYTFAEGWEEVAQILQGHPMQTFEPSLPTPTEWVTYVAEYAGYEISYPLEAYSVTQGVGSPQLLQPGVLVLQPNDSLNREQPLAPTYKVSITVRPNDEAYSLNDARILLSNGPIVRYGPDLLEGYPIVETYLHWERALRVDGIPVGLGGGISQIVSIHNSRIYELIVEPYQVAGESSRNEDLVEAILASFRFLD